MKLAGLGTVAAVLIFVQLAIYAGIAYIVYATLSHFGII